MIKTISQSFTITAIILIVVFSFSFSYGFAYFDKLSIDSQNKQVSIGFWEQPEPADLNFTLVNNSFYSVSMGLNNTASTVIIPETFNGLPVSEISSTFLDGYDEVTELIILADIPVLDSQEFRNSLSLEIISFYYEVTQLGNQVFRNTPNAIELYLYGNTSVVPSTHNLAFRDSSLQNVHVPSNMVSAFESNSSFSSFNIIPID